MSVLRQDRSRIAMHQHVGPVPGKRPPLRDVLEERYQQTDEDEWETSDFYCRRIGPDVYLLTYTLRQAKRVTRRSTLWQHAPGQWKVLYHQGTIVVDTQPRS